MFPTHVGMNRGKHQMNKKIKNVPHTRGDEPAEMSVILSSDLMFPTHVGMNRSLGIGYEDERNVPHTRGDEPRPVVSSNMWK